MTIQHIVHSDIATGTNSAENENIDDDCTIVYHFYTEDGKRLQLTASQEAELCQRLKDLEGASPENSVIEVDDSCYADYATVENGESNARANAMDVDQQILRNVSNEDKMVSFGNHNGDEDGRDADAPAVKGKYSKFYPCQEPCDS